MFSYNNKIKGNFVISFLWGKYYLLILLDLFKESLSNCILRMCANISAIISVFHSQSPLGWQSDTTGEKDWSGVGRTALHVPQSMTI